VPESHSSSRSSHGASIFPPSGEGQPGAGLRLRVLRSLPVGHQQYLFEEIRKLCADYLRRNRVPPSQMTPEELVSEVWLKLLGAVSVEADTPQIPGEAVAWSTDSESPERDGRIVWLIQEIGGSEAIAHRREDILRQRHGRAQPGLGRRLVQSDPEDEFPDTDSELGGPRAIEAGDAYSAWRGLLIAADLEFREHEDASMLLRLMSDVPDILDDSSGRHWPVQKMIALLNDHFPPPSWDGDRVDNAKRRLVKWINRLMLKNGLDTIDLEALFARLARQKDRGEGTLPLSPHRPTMTS
jgi:hypothetical protein